MTVRATAAILAVLLGIVLGGCTAWSSNALISENNLLPHAELKKAWSARPLETSHARTRIGDGPVVQLAIHATGKKSADRVVVLLHGVFADHSSWRFVGGGLGAEEELILVDLPGCGDSDRPAPATLGPNGYGPDAMAERVLQTGLGRRRGEVHFERLPARRVASFAPVSVPGGIRA